MGQVISCDADECKWNDGEGECEFSYVDLACQHQGTEGATLICNSFELQEDENDETM